MKIALITGANKGIGFETTKQLLQKGYQVFLGSRNVTKGQKAVDELKEEGFKQVALVPLDVTHENSVAEAYKYIQQKTGRLDVLINNAGIGGEAQLPTEVSIENFKRVYETNVYGVIRVTTTFLDLLQQSEAPRIVNVSSNMGSLTLQSDPSYHAYDYKTMVAYASSKSALNMFTIHLAYALKASNFKVNAVCPGYTSTDFTGNNGGSVEEAASRIVKYAVIDQDGPSGKFFSEELKTETGAIAW